MKNPNRDCDLKTCFMCRHSLKEWKQAIDANRKMYYFKKGEMLCHEDEVVNGIFFVFSGTVKVHKKWGDDKELIVRFAKKGDIVGHRGLGTATTFPISATALGPVSACYIDLQFFLTTLKVNQDFLFQLMLFFADELKESGQFKMATDGMDKLNFNQKETWEMLYRKWIDILPNEIDEEGYGCINGINIFKYFRPWPVFNLDPKTATQEEIKTAFYQLSKIYHPDNQETGDRKIFERLNQMYKSLIMAIPKKS